ncbi:hypothetical protein OAR97_04465 [Arcobacteraceae bacterium]|nr:hypothetical protein [Arcobacteraceae bacterium]
MKYFSNSINKFLVVSILLCTTNTFALSEQAEEGKELYSSASCTQCHGDIGNFDLKNQKAQNIAELTTWVERCDAGLGTGWFPEEQISVVKYLDESYYKYNKN